MSDVSADEPRSDAPIIHGIESLGGRAAVYLLALIRAARLGQRLAPTDELASDISMTLDILGVIRTIPPGSFQGTRTNRSRAPWVYTWRSEPIRGLEQRLRDYLTSEGRQKTHGSTWEDLWRTLVLAETTAFLREQLIFHQLSVRHGCQVSGWIGKNISEHSLAHWLHACMASVRCMATMRTVYPMNHTLLQLTLDRELRARADQKPSDVELTPKFGGYSSTVATILATVATQIGDAYWKSVPKREHLSF